MQLITKTDDLAAACASLSGETFVTIDTEFVRESTFWPELCLIQLAGTDLEILVDPLADGIDLAPFFALMADANVTKVFHAARQDIEIIHHMAGLVPRPIFDSQVAAMVCGFGESVSYQNLVKTILGVDLDKSSQFTDWRGRPLTDRQLAYALADVTHLRGIYDALSRQLAETGRADWLNEEMEILSAPGTYEAPPDEAWKRLKMRVKGRRGVAIMMELAAWRETVAQDSNVPRQRVLKDDAIYDIANQAPQDRKQLSRLRTVHDGIAKSDKADAILAAVRRGLARDPQSVPMPKRGTALPPEAAAVVELLKVLLKSVAAEHDVAAKLIANADDLERIALGKLDDLPAVRGWRHELFGADALALRNGELGLAIRKGQVVRLKLDGDDVRQETAA